MFIIVMIFIYIFTSKVSANEFKVAKDVYVYDDNETIFIYEKGILIDKLDNSKILDLSDLYLLYNRDNNIYLYDIKNKFNSHIDSGYNGLISNNIVVYENNSNNDYKCRNIVTNQTNNCTKLYKYEIDAKHKEYISIMGNDIYLNDIEDENLIFNSLHLIDDYCNGVCSYIGIYNLNNKKSTTITTYNDKQLNMSGNGFIENNILIFESLLGDYVHAIKYDIVTKSITHIQNKEGSFYKDIEIIMFNGEYFIFKSNINYQGIKLYIYSLNDDKYDEFDLECKIFDFLKGEIVCLNNDVIRYHSIDQTAPNIDTSNTYNLLIGKEDVFFDNLVINDNLSKRENLLVEIVGKVNIDSKKILIRVCDSFLNCNEEYIKVNVIESDLIPPLIYCQDTIYLNLGEIIDINDYGYAIDNIDGVIDIYLEGNINFKQVGEQRVLLKTIDSSGNSAIKEIRVIVYRDHILYKYYFISIGASCILVIINYIFRFKKRY